MPGYKKSGGNWLNLAPYGKVSGAWTQAKESFIKKDGIWKQYWLQDGANDSIFNTVDNIPKSFSNTVQKILIDSDNKILVAGSFTTYKGVSSPGLIRLNSDTSIDSSFSVGTGSGFSTIYSIAIQTDNKILICGGFSSYNGTSKNKIVRLNSDGSIDSSFNIGTGLDNTAYDINIQSDGKIVVVGDFKSYNGTTINKIIRLNSDGSIDSSFTVGTAFNDSFYQSTKTIAIQSDGKILVGGNFTSYNGTTSNKIVRLNSDGSIDSSFDIGTGFDTTVNIIRLQSDGKILVGGNFQYYNGQYSPLLIRLNSDGTKDTSISLSMAGNSIHDVKRSSDGSFFAAGLFYNNSGQLRGGIIKINSSGSQDLSFQARTKFFQYQVYSIIINSDSTIFAGGNFIAYDNIPQNYITHISSTAALLPTFPPNYGASDTILTTDIQSDDKILIAGGFTIYNGVSINRIARLNPDGSIDSSFNVGTGFDSTVYVVKVQSNGKILVGGTFTSYNGITANRIIRLNSDGSIDSSFNAGNIIPNNWVYALAIQSDGKITAIGAIYGVNGLDQNHIVRLNSDGTVDSSFNVGTGFNAIAYAIALQSDGKVVVGGDFTSYNGTTINRIVRLNSDGSIDSSFNVGTGFIGGYVQEMIIQPDNKVLLGGVFSSYNGTSRNGIARLNSNGTLDTSFDPGTGFNYYGYINSLYLESNGDIIVGGAFESYNGTYRPYLLKLNKYGVLDPMFNGANSLTVPSQIFDIKAFSNNKKIMVGTISKYGNSVRNNLAVIGSDLYVRPPVFTSLPTATSIDSTSATISWGSTGQDSYSITLSPAVSGQPFTGTTATSRLINGLSQLTNYTSTVELFNRSTQSTIENTSFSTPETPAVGPWSTNIIATTGDNSTSSPNINNIYYRRQILMWVYTAAEISAAFGGLTSATISKMRFNVTQQPLNQPLPDYAIGMKQGSFAGNPGNTGYTIVKNASSESFTTGAMKIFDFNTPFVWNNQDIAIVTAWGQCPVDWNSSGTGPIGSGTSYYARVDDAGTYVINTDSAGSANNARPVVDFYFTV